MIYADHNGSSPVLPAVREYLKERLDSQFFANPNSLHSIGQKLHQGLEFCRIEIAKILGAEASQVIFNSGASEGINHVLYHLCWKHFYPGPIKKKVYVSTIEHAAVSQTIQFLQKKFNFELVWIPAHHDGSLNFDWLKEQIKEHNKNIAFVTCIAANNETGVYQPYLEINQLCQKHRIDFFSDTTQVVGKEPFHFLESGLDYAILSGHKVGALPGIGALIVKNPETLTPLILGGGQENNLRSGTQNYIGVECLLVALKEFQASEQKRQKLRDSKLHFEHQLKASCPNMVIIGENQKRLAGTSLVGYPGLHSQGIQIELEAQDIFVTTSSACSDNQPETSAILKGMGIKDDLGRSVIRISLSYLSNPDEYQKILVALIKAYKKLTKIEFHHAP